MIYKLSTPVGQFSIEPYKTGCRLFITTRGEKEYLGYYLDPVMAADDVYTQHTGFHSWDSLPSETVWKLDPEDLSSWEMNA